jgi:hypothetical protein
VAFRRYRRPVILVRDYLALLEESSGRYGVGDVSVE